MASYLSAIEHWGLGQLEADRPNLTVPRTLRRALPTQIRPAPILHRRDLEWQRDVTFSDRGFKVTTVPRTITDIAPLVDADHLALTLQDAFRRGYLSPELLDHWLLQATPDGAAAITRAQAQLKEGNVAVR